MLLIIMLAALSVMDHQGWLLVPRVDDLSRYHGATGRVSRVIDGDTLDIEIHDPLHDRPVTRIRLWGIDCPETASLDHPAEPLADHAAAFVRALIGDRDVILYLEPHRTRGTFGRLLAHVEITGRGSLNLALLEAGLAAADDRWPHKHLERYAKAQRAARQDKIGLWALNSEDDS